MKRVIALCLIFALLLLVGCSKDKDLTIDETPSQPVEDNTHVNDSENPDIIVNETQEENLSESMNNTGESVEINKTEEVVIDLSENVTTNETSINETEVIAIESQKVITIYDFTAHPQELEITVGTTVVWSNEEENFQHIIGWTKMPVSAGVLLPGTTWNYTFEEPGQITWFSTPKPRVQGTITITE